MSTKHYTPLLISAVQTQHGKEISQHYSLFSCWGKQRSPCGGHLEAACWNQTFKQNLIDRKFPLGCGSARHIDLVGAPTRTNAPCVWLTRLVLKVLQTLASLDHLGDVLLHDVDHLVDLRLHPGDSRGPIGSNSRQAGIVTLAFFKVSFDVC